MIKGLASSFADAKDIAAYRNAVVTFLQAGFSQHDAEQKALAVGDPGKGWMDNDLSNDTPWVALPVEDWKAKFGPNNAKSKAHRAKVNVTINGKTVTCILGDTMPHKEDIHNGAVVDLAPGAQKAFNLKPPFMVPCMWEWAQ